MVPPGGTPQPQGGSISPPQATDWPALNRRFRTGRPSCGTPQGDAGRAVGHRSSSLEAGDLSLLPRRWRQWLLFALTCPQQPPVPWGMEQGTVLELLAGAQKHRGCPGPLSGWSHAVLRGSRGPPALPALCWQRGSNHPNHPSSIGPRPARCEHGRLQPLSGH